MVAFYAFNNSCIILGKVDGKVVYYYHFINFAVLSLFLISWCFLPQQLPLVTIPFAMSLWLRSGTNYLIGRKDNLKSKQFKSAKYMQAGWKR